MAIKPSKTSQNASTPILKAVTLCKTGPLQYQAYELSIQDGKVIGKRLLGRGAPDVSEIQISRCEDVLWSIREQTESAIEIATTV
jgi:hypothetical protein